MSYPGSAPAYSASLYPESKSASHFTAAAPQPSGFCSSCGTQRTGAFCGGCGAGASGVARPVSAYNPTQYQPQPQAQVYAAQPIQMHQIPVAQPVMMHVAQQPVVPSAVVQQPGMQQPMAHSMPPAQNSQLAERPALGSCKQCGFTGMTTVVYQNNARTHWTAAACCLCCGPLCMLVPYYMMKEKLQDAEHHCTQCNTVVAKFVRGEGTQVV